MSSSVEQGTLTVFTINHLGCNGLKLREEMEFQFQEHRWVCGVERREPTTTPIVHLVFFSGCGGYGTAITDFEDHFVLVFDQTSTREASKGLALFPEITGSSLTLKLLFGKALEKTVELFVIAERFSQSFIDSQRNITKNSLL